MTIDQAVSPIEPARVRARNLAKLRTVSKDGKPFHTAAKAALSEPLLWFELGVGSACDLSFMPQDQLTSENCRVAASTRGYGS